VFAYLICFTCSVWFAYRAQKSRSKTGFVILSIISIAITVLLAGLRDISIGIDTLNFYNGTWMNAIRSSTLQSFLHLYNNYHISKEYLYALIVGIVAKTTGDFHLLLVIIHSIIIGGFYIGACRFKKYADPALSLFLFYFFYFNTSLNIFRQFTAMAILFAAAADLGKGRHLRYLFFAMVAFFVHNTAVFGLLLLLLYRLLYPKGRLSNVPLSKRLLIYSFILIAVCSFLPLIRSLNSVGMFKKYTFFINADSTSAFKAQRLMALVEVLGFVVFLREFRKKYSDSEFFLVCVFSFVVLYQLAAKIPYGQRLPAYFSFYNIVALGMLAKCSLLQRNRMIIQVLVVCAALVYWLFVHVHHNGNETIPYLLGI
jgi:hypothetical protein